MNSRSVVQSPIGWLALTATSRGLAEVSLLATDVDFGPTHGDSESQSHLRAAEQALSRYFAGSVDACRDVVIVPEGTDFQRAVWAVLRTIPVGTTICYRELAGRIGKPDAVRAVGLANGRNPIPIVVPCHRVIGADRSLTGFGLGVSVKAWLLVHERAAEPFPAIVTAATRVVAPASLWAPCPSRITD